MTQNSFMKSSIIFIREHLLVTSKLRQTIISCDLKDKSGLDKIIVEKQPYQLLNTNREFFPSFDTSNFHKLVNETS